MASADDPTAKYRATLDSLTHATETGEIDPGDADRIRTYLDAKDGRKASVPAPDSGTCALLSLNTYCHRLLAIARERHLSGMDASGVNQLIDDLRTGATEAGPPDGYANGSMQAICGALSGFYEVHKGLGVDPDEIASAPASDPAVDSRTVLSREDVDAMRDVIDNSRDRALFELFTFTMQRVRAIQTLRIRDVDVDEGSFYLNDEASGLKGASGKRPLLGARGPVRRWLQDHPTGDPDDYLITALPSASRGNPGQQLGQTSITKRLELLGERAGVDKPVNPHAFRHYGVTVARRVYDMSWGEIAFMGSWASPQTPRRIYEHLADEDFIAKIEKQFGIREPDEDDETKPIDTICPTCDAVLRADAKACPDCGTVLTADAAGVAPSLHEIAEPDDRASTDEIAEMDDDEFESYQRQQAEKVGADHDRMEQLSEAMASALAGRDDLSGVSMTIGESDDGITVSFE